MYTIVCCTSSFLVVIIAACFMKFVFVFGLFCFSRGLHHRIDSIDSILNRVGRSTNPTWWRLALFTKNLILMDFLDDDVLLLLFTRTSHGLERRKPSIIHWVVVLIPLLVLLLLAFISSHSPFRNLFCRRTTKTSESIIQNLPTLKTVQLVKSQLWYQLLHKKVQLTVFL